MFSLIPWKIVSAGAGLLCVFLAVMLMTANGQKAGLRKKLAAEVEAHAATVAKLARCKDNAAELEAAAARQDESVRRLEKAGQDATKAAQQAQRAAEKASRPFLASSARIAAAKPGPDLCESARELLSNTLKEERR